MLSPIAPINNLKGDYGSIRWFFIQSNTQIEKTDTAAPLDNRCSIAVKMEASARERSRWKTIR